MSDFPFVPALLGAAEIDGWIVLIQEDVNGYTPSLPWVEGDLAQVRLALKQLAEAGAPCPVRGIPSARQQFKSFFRGADRLVEDGVNIEGLSEIRDLSVRASTVLHGDCLVHADLRADNILIGSEGAILVDWPWACVGPAWLDTLLIMIEVQRFGGFDVDKLLRADCAMLDVDNDDLTSVLAALVGYFLDAARNTAPAGVVGVREFQQKQGEILHAWVLERL